ncbi:helix-turn-helix domain-containing protein [Xanthocytophaga agilis]|uniref:Helix-turn-helix domain-containing protein n=1 Tax=Xanthocytophaga agilis TaxID=3048010 RepID=A0AAE3R4U6_9BACT|nr:helix-turn-helix domain-containing protein [Xanthocytophaga agilis]MDJ1500692.1 helix-turn-helix domain-containing protein [Xanthocytophaga agilis]
MITLHDKVYTCPVDVSLRFISGKWKILILFHLFHFEKRSFSELRDNLPGVAEKVLTQQLKELEKDNMISRRVLSEKPLRVEYFLTEQGLSMSPMYEFLSKWGIAYLEKNGIDYIQDQHLYK